MISAIWTWFISSKVGRWLAGAVAAIAVIGAMILKAYSAGKAHEKAAEDHASLENLRHRSESDAKIDSLPVAERRSRLGFWVRD